MFTRVQLSVIPADKRGAFVALTHKGVRPSKAAGKLGITLSQHDSQLLTANIANIAFASSEADIAAVYNDTYRGQSCMSSHPSSPAYVYSRVGAHVAYNDGARTVVNPKTKTFGRIYGERSSDLYYTLLALGYNESASPLAGLSGILDHSVIPDVVEWTQDVYTYEWQAGASEYLCGDYWHIGETMTHKGELFRVSGLVAIGGEKYTRITRIKKIAQKRVKTVYKAPHKFYIDGEHVLHMEQGRLIITGGGSPCFVDFKNLNRVIPTHKVFRKIERKGLADIADDFERRVNKWKH